MAHSGLGPQNFLLMIENSSALAPFWPDLRDCYLPRLVEQLSGTYNTHQTNIFISESRPASHDFHNNVTRQHGSLQIGLKEFQFNYDPDNRLSTTQIQSCIEFLSSSGTSQIQHLIIVAATTPTVELGDVQLLYDPWHEMAKMLTQSNIYLHLALTSNLRSGLLPNLFEQTFKWQQTTESEHFGMPLSSLLLLNSYRQLGHEVPETEAESPPRLNSRASRETLGSDMYTTKSLDDISSESPSLVSQLQQVHGLAKKKVYGHKPARVPFIMNDRARDKYCKSDPAPLTIPASISLAPESGPPPSLTMGGRSRSKARADRPLTSRHQRQVDPYTSHQTQRRQPTSSPEGDPSTTSPYSCSTGLSPSPVARMHASENYAFGATSLAAGHTVLPRALGPPWDQTSNAPSSNQPPFYPPFPTSGFVPRNDPFQLPNSQGLHSFPHGRGVFPYTCIPTPCETMSTSSATPFPSPTYTQPPNVDLSTSPDPQFEFRPDYFHHRQKQDDPVVFPFAPALPSAHTYHPAPLKTIAIPDAQISGPVCAPLPRRIMQPIPMLPPISAPELHDGVESFASAASQSMQPPKARHPSTAAPRVPTATASTASSSLTGWAG
ncbi:hypothetical protein C8R43DRAFT_1131711 [Mycena crocata]|nr:hypothetical protein C8R43DRAFT_1131711 [Mycena crocata]